MTHVVCENEIGTKDATNAATAATLSLAVSTPATVTAAAAAHPAIAYLTSLFEPGDRLNIKLIHATDQYAPGQFKTHDYFQSIEETAMTDSIEFLNQKQRDGWHIFVCMSPFRAATTSRFEENISEIRAVYIDIDEDGDTGLARIETAVRNGEIPRPSLILRSSPGKYQCVWKVKNFTLPLQRATNEALVSKFGGDPASVDGVRVLRLPGFCNLKPKYGNPPPMVEIVQQDVANKQRYGVEDFVIKIAVKAEPSKNPAITSDKLQMIAELMEKNAEEAGFELGRCQKDRNGLKWVVDCPWADAHTQAGTSALIMLLEDGRPEFNCFHNHCAKRGWSDIRVLWETAAGHHQCFSEPTPDLIFHHEPSSPATAATAPTISAEKVAEKAAIIANWRASFRTVGELEDGDIKMLVDGFMPHGMNFIGALPGEAKTLFALSITRALTTGRPLLGNPQWTIPAIIPVIYMIPEVGARAFKKRLTKFQIPSDENLFICRTISEGGTLRLSDPILQEAVKVLKPVIILDTLIRFSEADDENASMQNKKLGDDIIRLLHLGAVSVISLHHAAKSMRNDGMTLENVLRGTGDLAAMADVVYGLKRDDKLYDNGAGALEVEVRCLKPRDLEHPPLPFRMAASRKMEGRNPNNLAGEVGMAMGIESVINASGDFALVGQSAKQARFEAQLAEAIADDPRITITTLSKALGENSTKIQRMLTHLGWAKPKAGPIERRIWTRSGQGSGQASGQGSQGDGQVPSDDAEDIPDFPNAVEDAESPLQGQLRLKSVIQGDESRFFEECDSSS